MRGSLFVEDMMKVVIFSVSLCGSEGFSTKSTFVSM